MQWHLLSKWCYNRVIVNAVAVVPGRLLIVVAALQHVSCLSHDVCSRSYSLSTIYLGLNYEVLVWPPGNHDDSEASFSVVASQYKATSVRVRFPSWQQNCVIMFGALRLDCDQTLDFTLHSMETATFTSTSTDLSGTLVEASKPVAVYVNNTRVEIGPGDVTDSMSEQLFPMTAWGRQFVLAPVPDNSLSGYSISITCGSAVDVSVDIAGVVHQLVPQRAFTTNFTDNRPAYVSVVGGSGSAAIQLMQFVRGATVATDSGAPAALVVPAVERYSDVYSLTTSEGFTEYVSIVIRQSDISGLRLNGLPLGLSGSDWKNVGSSSDWVTAAVQLPASTSSTLEHIGQRLFGAYSYGYVRGRCAFAHPSGASLPLQVSD